MSVEALIEVELIAKVEVLVPGVVVTVLRRTPVVAATKTTKRS
jgi:hypothetical protein